MSLFYLYHVLADLNNTELFKYWMAITSNSNMSHIIAEQLSQVLAFPRIIIHKEVPNSLIDVLPLESLRVDDKSSLISKISNCFKVVCSVNVLFHVMSPNVAARKLLNSV